MTIKMYYRIAGVLSNACAPADLHKSESGPFIHSISNLEDNRLRDNGNNINTNNTLEFTVSPNPAKNQITINLPTHSVTDERIEIINVLGLSVAEPTFNSSSRTLSISIEPYHLTPGIYYVRISTAEKQGVKRFVKE